ncbi:hypothetical protein ABPG75_002289 [Micractinium tetrahymenae]
MPQLLAACAGWQAPQPPAGQPAGPALRAAQVPQTLAAAAAEAAATLAAVRTGTAGGPAAAAAPAAPSQDFGPELVNKIIRVFWPDTQRFEPAVVREYSSNGVFLVDYAVEDPRIHGWQRLNLHKARLKMKEGSGWRLYDMGREVPDAEQAQQAGGRKRRR